MRISDWSSDVCSSDLHVSFERSGKSLGRLADEEGMGDAAVVGLQPGKAAFLGAPAGDPQDAVVAGQRLGGGVGIGRLGVRSEEHTSELQSLMRISYAVFCLKKKRKNKQKRYRRK